MEEFQLALELIGAAAFAVSGAALGIQKNMDMLGVAMMGMTTAVGGGMLRDVLLGITPPSALLDPTQALLAIVVSLLLFLLHRRWNITTDNRATEMALRLTDSIGLGIFTAHGVLVCESAGMGDRIFLTLFLSVLTGVGGGLLRDVCCMEKPYIFTKHFYACASLAGAALCLALWSFGATLAMLSGSALTVVLRLCAAHFRWSLPKA